ncbi:MAG: DNA-binding transcription factor yap1 [Piccolia ochrophora]|nr:MAG: DNA-binding transcription factor yap1 [Piccolia ochrophora]
MTTTSSSGTFVPDLSLSPGQEDLLTAALASNNPNGTLKGKPDSRVQLGESMQNPQTYSLPTSVPHVSHIYSSSPQQQTPGSASLANVGLDESPFLDYDPDADYDGSFDFDGLNGQMIGNLPGESLEGEDDIHEKRKSIGDANQSDGRGGKRREGEEKTAKKPGRKPLTSEPTNKRKAQNRAAQRAFRDRKEKHLKDLEVKVADLEKASESRNHENELLRAQVDRLHSELKDYRKRLSSSRSALSRSPPAGAALPSYYSQNNNGNASADNFHFDFPRFGSVAGSNMIGTSLSPTKTDNATEQKGALAAPYNVPGVLNRNDYEINGQSTNDVVPSSQTKTTFNNGSSVDDLKGLFSPSVLESVRNSPAIDYWSHSGSDGNSNKPARTSSDNSTRRSHSSGLNTSASASASPSSSLSQQGPSSSCGTTPEPSNQSPVATKPSDNLLTTISEENTALSGFDASQPMSANTDMSFFGKTPSDLNTFDWLAQQNGGQFDPVLFGDYREPQEAIVSGDYGNFFDDALPFTDLSNTFVESTAMAPRPGKSSLMDEIEQNQNADHDIAPSGPDAHKALDCNSVWLVISLFSVWRQSIANSRCRNRNFIQSREDFQNGELDVESLCADLRKKAKCTETGESIDQSEVDHVLDQLHKN